MAFSTTSSPDSPRRRPAAVARPTARGRLQLAASALVVLAALAWCRTAHAESIMQQVFDVEARYGNDPNDVIAHLRALEVPARASGGDDLRAFLAAWGYAHAAIDKPAVADAYGALAYLSSLPYVDAERVAVVGFSQGGDTALKIATGGGRRSAGVSSWVSSMA